MSINYLPIDNSIALVTSAVTDALTGDAITDATITAAVLTVGGSSLCSASMTHDAGGIYKGTLDLSTASTDLVLNTHYYLQLSASNYALVWKRLLRAEDRPLVGSGSVSIDLTPGTTGLTSITGIALGDGTGAYTGLASTGTGLVVRDVTPSLGSSTIVNGFGNASLTISAPAAAAAGFPAYTGGIYLKGNAYDTGASASRGTDWEVFNLPADANPAVSSLRLAYQYNSGGYATKFAFGSDGTIKNGSGVSLIPRHSTIVIAASDSANKGGADYICDGTADQVEIQAAINSISANSQAANIFLRCGTYNLTDTISINRSYICLEGEHGGNFADFVTPAAGAMLLMGVSAKPIIKIDLTTRHVIGTTIARLLFVGDRSSGGHGITMVTGGFGTDYTTIRDCVIFKCDIGMNLPQLGVAEISRNSIQELVGAGIVLIGQFCKITNNMIWAPDGYGIILGAHSACYTNIVANNNIGAVSGAGHGIADFSVGGNVISGNIIGGLAGQGQIAGCGIRLEDQGQHTSDDTIIGNVIVMNDGTTAEAIRIGTDSVGTITDHCTITGNRIRSDRTTTTTAYAIKFSNTAHKCIALGNVIETGKWNGGSSTDTILWGDASNVASGNVGDNGP